MNAQIRKTLVSSGQRLTYRANTFTYAVVHLLRGTCTCWRWTFLHFQVDMQDWKFVVIDSHIRIFFYDVNCVTLISVDPMIHRWNLSNTAQLFLLRTVSITSLFYIFTLPPLLTVSSTLSPPVAFIAHAFSVPSEKGQTLFKHLFKENSLWSFLLNDLRSFTYSSPLHDRLRILLRHYFDTNFAILHMSLFFLM